MAITNVIEIPVTNQNYPFSSAAGYGVLDNTGYTEKEYFLHGTANVYQTQADGSISIRFADAPYINRIIVRAPEDSAKCSGNTVVEIINPTASFEIERMWILSHRKLLRDGDIYVGITSKPNTIAKLLEFNAERYGALSWANPTPEQPLPYTAEDIQANPSILLDQDIAYETGLFWDMLRDLPSLLRSDRTDNPLADYCRQNIILTGWSQSAAYLIRYLNVFAYMNDEELPCYDGYLAAGPPRHITIPINQYEQLSCIGQSTPLIKEVRQPCIILQTESENGHMDAYKLRRPDGSEENFLCRHYDIAGASHDTKYSLIDYYRNDPDMIRIGILPKYTGIHKFPNNYPLEIPMAAAFRNLFYWINSGVAPSVCDPIKVDCHGDNCKDVLGNSIGGVRTCLLDVPSGSYHSYSLIRENEPLSRESRNVSGYNIVFGHEEPFSPDMLRQMYGSLENYETLARRHTQEQVAKGFVIREDAPKLVQIAVELAKSRGLE